MWGRNSGGKKQGGVKNWARNELGMKETSWRKTRVGRK